MSDDCGASSDLPQRPALHQPWEELRFGRCESKHRTGLCDLVGGLSEQDSGLGIREQAHGHLRRGGAVVGLGPQVGQSVDDSEFILAPEATELRHLGVHTVEQLADASDILCEQLPRGFELREHARNWYRVNHGRSVVDTTKKLGAELNEAREVMTRQAKALEDTQKQLAEMREAMRSFNRAQMEATIETDTKKVKK